MDERLALLLGAIGPGVHLSTDENTLLRWSARVLDGWMLATLAGLISKVRVVTAARALEPR